MSRGTGREHRICWRYWNALGTVVAVVTTSTVSPGAEAVVVAGCDGLGVVGDGGDDGARLQREVAERAAAGRGALVDVGWRSVSSTLSAC